ncbi:hypothetical protein FisN_16Hu201 [Fistulifera solaris]|uniref:Uncharacterized protein n=1 Tax=Fistulifera solaris TaxID=1519565 RepID=A0A1Z5KTF2_FISSO|nr:hypothetical protein FisN_16Hu201 [Fistulifera solaris]|eukprot:GAX29362.1 hypothetical protein FisN_16Hu201 [Fistulifera solaris]
MNDIDSDEWRTYLSQLKPRKAKRPKKNPLLESVSEYDLSARQKELLSFLKRSIYYDIYKFLREPMSLDEFCWKEMHHHCLFWRENETVIVIGDEAYKRHTERNVCFELYHAGKRRKVAGCIFGDDDEKIAETLAFFLSLKDGGKNGARLEIDFNMSTSSFCMSALQPEHLAQILDANPTRQYMLQAGIWTPEQTAILGSRPYPLHLTLTRSGFGEGSGFRFKDGGAAFVDALAGRQSSFGTLIFDFHCDRETVPLTLPSVKRLVEVGTFDKLSMGIWSRSCVLSPFSAKTNSLLYVIDEMFIEPADFSALDIVAKDLTINFVIRRRVRDYGELLISFLTRVAQLGHFEKIYFSVQSCKWFKFDKIAPVAAALVNVIEGNPNLKHLDLSNTFMPWNWGPHLENVFKALEEHKMLRTFAVPRYPPEDPTYSWLEQLLSRNRMISVVNRSGKKCLNGSSIDRLYLFNQFFHGSESLVKESPTLRPLLVPTALIESVCMKHTTLLLSNHADKLCEFLNDLDVDD